MTGGDEPDGQGTRQEDGQGDGGRAGGRVARVWPVAMCIASAVLLVAVTVGYVGAQQRRSDRRWCELLTSLDAPDSPPRTPWGQRVRGQARELRAELGCR